jgi:hypothetical protein
MTLGPLWGAACRRSLNASAKEAISSFLRRSVQRATLIYSATRRTGIYAIGKDLSDHPARQTWFLPVGVDAFASLRSFVICRHESYYSINA